MKKLVTITGAPASTKSVVKEVAFQLGKVAVFWIASHAVNKAVFNALETKTRSIDWTHPAFRI